MDSPELVAALAVSFSLRLLVIYLGMLLACVFLSHSVADNSLVPIAVVSAMVASVPRVLGILFSLATDRWMAYAALILAFFTMWPLLVKWARLAPRRALYVALIADALLAVFSLALL